MTVVHITEATIRAQHLEEAVHLGLEVAKLHERLGASSSRVLYDLVAGERAQSVLVWAEFEDVEAFGRSVDAGAYDGETLSLAQRLAADNGPVAVRSRLLAVEVSSSGSGGRRKVRAEHGSVVELMVYRPAAGRLEDAVGVAEAAGDFAADHGARSARLFRSLHAGRSTRLLIAAWEFADATGFGHAADELFTSAKGRSVAAATTVEDAPATVEWHGAFHAVDLDGGARAAAPPEAAEKKATKKAAKPRAAKTSS